MSDTDRYVRQMRYAPLGEAGQVQLGQSTALICGCGALGSLIAERLARSGVGKIRIVDRDWVELSNLQRQTLFTEEDARAMNPKAVAAAMALKKINSQIEIEPIVSDLTYLNIQELADGCDLILDGTDNFETRFLINDYSVSTAVPWVHGGCLGASGQVLTILPDQSACFRCLVPELPPREALETCDTAGVLGPAIGIVASWQAAEGLKILSGNVPAACRGLMVFDSWNSESRIIQLSRNKQCVACNQRRFQFLSGELRTEVTVLCGKNAVQLECPGAGGTERSWAQLAESLGGLGQISHNKYFLRLKLADHTLTIFRGGRTVVEGTTSESEAKSVLSRTLGS